jgi:hypothetical protein
LNAPVHLVATLTVSGQGVHHISYRSKSTRPTSAEVRKAAAFLARWKSTPGLTHIFVPPAAAKPELSRSRISYLEKRFPVNPAGSIESDKSLDANAVLIQLLQQVDVSHSPSVPATPKQP